MSAKRKAEDSDDDRDDDYSPTSNSIAISFAWYKKHLKNIFKFLTYHIEKNQQEKKKIKVATNITTSI